MKDKGAGLPSNPERRTGEYVVPMTNSNFLRKRAELIRAELIRAELIRAEVDRIKVGLEALDFVDVKLHKISNGDVVILFTAGKEYVNGVTKFFSDSCIDYVSYDDGATFGIEILDDISEMKYVADQVSGLNRDDLYTDLDSLEVACSADDNAAAGAGIEGERQTASAPPAPQSYLEKIAAKRTKAGIGAFGALSGANFPDKGIDATRSDAAMSPYV